MANLDGLKNIYYNPSEPGSFGGVHRLWKANKNVSRHATRKWLAHEDVYTLHKPVRYKFQRRKTIAYGVNELWQIDLLDMQKFSRSNKGYRYILTMIDVFSRFLRAYPIKDKKARTVANVFRKVFKQITPALICSDKGNEFFNIILSNLFKKHNIHHYTTKSEVKCAILERVHRTIRERLQRIFTYRNSTKYYDVLQSLVDSYNQTTHSAHGFKPVDVSVNDESVIYKRLYGMISHPKFRFAPGDVVRISKVRKTFKKGYLPGWSEETFKIKKRYPTTPHTYVLEDYKGREIDGRFYNEEIQKIEKTYEDYWAVEKIIRSRGKGSTREHLVKWTGFDDSFNTWVSANAIRE